MSDLLALQKPPPSQSGCGVIPNRAGASPDGWARCWKNGGSRYTEKENDGRSDEFDESLGLGRWGWGLGTFSGCGPKTKKATLGLVIPFSPKLPKNTCISRGRANIRAQRNAPGVM